MPLSIPRSDRPDTGGLRIDVFRGEGPEPSRPVLLPVVFLSWTPTHLLATVVVNDDTPGESPADDRLYLGDSVELLLSTDNPADGMTQLVVAPGGRWQVLEYRRSGLRATAVKPDVRVDRSPAGYRAELALPFAAMGIQPREGLVVGVRVQVSDADGRGRTWKRTLVGVDRSVEFFRLPKFTLSAESGQVTAPAGLLAVWAEAADLQAARIYVDRGSDLAGKPTTLLVGGEPLAPASVEVVNGLERTVYEVQSPPGKGFPSAELRGEGFAPWLIALPDLIAERQRVFLAGASGARGWGGGPPGWSVPKWSAEVFQTPQLPTLAYRDADTVARAFGAVSITTEYFDARYRRVDRAHRPGRYGAVSRIVSEVGEAVAYHTLFRTESPQEPGKSAADLAAEADGLGNWIQKSERDWWYPLQKSLGLARPYEVFVRLPKGYDDHPDRLYPVIVYLHGSGGGDRIASVLTDGPQAYAEKTPDLGMIVVSLRSPGGWNPPQVYDTLDALLPTIRHDRAMWYLTGFSMGGMGTWTVATDDPSRWAAIAPVGGRSGDPARAERLKDMPAWVFNGSADGTTTSKDALVAVDALRAAGNSRVKWTEFEGADHVDSLRLAYAMPELYAWFLGQRRS
jgi:acetyl esterase/lipase